MELIYQDTKVSCYADKSIRGNGIVDIQMLHNELIILNMDGTIHEKITFTEEEYYLENNLTKITARKVILNLDFFSLEFDCKEFNEEDEFVYIYLNYELRKIKKEDYILKYSSWKDYIKNSYVKILSDNLLIVKTEYGEKPLKTSVNHIYLVKELLEDKLYLKSTSTGCCKSIEDIEGFVKWRENNNLLVDICVID